MTVIQTGIQARWAAMSADPERAWQIQLAAWRREQAATRPRALATATAAKNEQAVRISAPADLVEMPAWLARSVSNAAGPARVDLLDEIGYFGITAADFASALAKLPAGPIELHISSPGGDVVDGLAMLNMLKQRPGTVTVVVDGLAASAASIVAMGASPGRLYMAQNALLMCHEAWTSTTGDEAAHQETAALLGQMSDNLAAIYAGRTGQPVSAMRAMMKAETWFVGQEAVDAGLADAMLPGSGAARVPDEWDAFASALTAAGGPGRPGNAALRKRVYNRFLAQPGRDQGRVSPFVAAVFRL